MDLLVSYPQHRFYPARREVRRILKRLGDPYPRMEWTAVEGLAIAHTTLDPRRVVAGCRELFCAGELPFEFALKWVPVDHWCPTDPDALRDLLAREVAPRIAAHETWALRVDRHRCTDYHTDELVARLAPLIERPVDLEHPDKTVRIDIVDARTAVAVLGPDEVFSVRKTSCPAPDTRGAPRA